MRKIFVILNSILIFSAPTTYTVSCGMADGDQVSFTFTDSSGNVNEVGSKKYENSTNDSNKDYDYTYIDMGQDVAVPLMWALNIGNGINLNGGNPSKALKNESLFAKKDYLTEDNQSWKDFFEEISTSKDTYFSKIEAGKNVPVDLSKIPNPQSLVNDNYFNIADSSNLQQSDFVITNVKGPNAIVFNKVSEVLNNLNTATWTQNIEGVASENKETVPPIIQQARHVLVPIGDIDYKITYVGIDKTFSFVVTLKNLVAHIDLGEYRHVIKDKTYYYPTWFFNNYDYYTSSRIDDITKKSTTRYAYNKQQVNQNITFYVGYADRAGPPLRPEEVTGETEKGTFQDMRKQQNKDNIFFRDLMISITKNSITEVD